MGCMRILIIGGTRFVGRHITQAALAAGHEVSLVHRGQTGAGLFPEAEHLLADRNGDLGVLKGRVWDATIDVSAYRPRQVTQLAEALDGNGGQYVYISSVSVYAPPAVPGYGEDSPVLRFPEGPVPEEITAQTYGPLKVLCEDEAVARFGAGTLVIRPTYVIGPHDHSGRFTYWVQRIARGGEVLAPGRADAAVQTIDARDQAAFIVGAVEAGRSGVFHTVGPSMAFREMLERIAAVVAPAGTRLTWVEPEFLLAAGQDDGTLPLWYAGNEDDAMVQTADPAAAVAAGLVLRPLEDTVRDLAGEPEAVGFLTAAEEARLLARWAERDAG